MQTTLSSIRLSYGERANLTSNPIAKKLFQIMEKKKSNLAVAADVTRSEDLLKLVEKIGSEICVLKTHIDILEDFSPQVTIQLQKLADKLQFIIFEDRKFADIGNTVVQQYQGGVYHIAEWADIINAHIVPGYGIIEGLKEVGLPRKRGLLLLAEMSSAGTMANGPYTQKAIDLAKIYDDFVIGFICLRKLIADPRFIHMTPGVQKSSGNDKLGQTYQTPENAIEQGSDIIIVGRGIYAAQDPISEAQQYKNRAWKAYVNNR
jgi:uridine monophosphate synthetase